MSILKSIQPIRRHIFIYFINKIGTPTIQLIHLITMTKRIDNLLICLIFMIATIAMYCCLRILVMINLRINYLINLDNNDTITECNSIPDEDDAYIRHVDIV